MLEIQSILHPTDFSESSLYALRIATSLARDHGAHLVLLHVVSSLGPELLSFGQAVSELQPDSYRASLLEELRQVEVPDRALTVERVVCEGETASEILRVAAEKGCGLIVMATHGRTGLDRLLMGSVAEQVVRKASCPVLTVKAPSTLGAG